jgi:hypothetical protein
MATSRSFGGRLLTTRSPTDFAGGDIFQAGDHAQQCRLAAAGGADQNDELAVINCDRDAVNNGRQSERLAHVANDDGRHCSSQLRVLAFLFGPRPGQYSIE